MRGQLFRIAVLFLLMVQTIEEVRAQYNFDVETVEAMIRDHKRIRSVLVIRDGVEQANAVLHQYSKKAAETHYEVNLNLDDFIRLFEVLDVIVNSTTTVYSAINTYDAIKERLDDYRELLNTYQSKLLLQGNVTPADTMIITVGSKAMEHIYEDGKNIYTSLSTIIGYASGAVPCNTANLLIIIGSIDETIDDIRKTLDRAYITTWRYVQLRLYYHKTDVYFGRDVRKVGQEALSRWKKSSMEALGKKGK